MWEKVKENFVFQLIIGTIAFIIFALVINWLLPNPIFDIKSTASPDNQREESNCTFGNDCW